MGQAQHDSAVGLLPVLCFRLLGFCSVFRQTDAAMRAKPVAVAVLLLVSRGARLAVVAIFLVESRKTNLGRSDLAPKKVA